MALEIVIEVPLAELEENDVLRKRIAELEEDNAKLRHSVIALQGELYYRKLLHQLQENIRKAEAQIPGTFLPFGADSVQGGGFSYDKASVRGFFMDLPTRDLFRDSPMHDHATQV